MANGTVEAPVTAMLPYGLLSAVPVVNHGADDERWASFFGLSWVPDACSFTSEYIMSECDPGTTPTVVNTGTVPDASGSSAPAFAVHVTDLCSSVFGLKPEEKTKRVNDATLVRSQHVVETALWAQFVAATPSAGPAGLDDLDDVEGAIGCGAGTGGVIHMSRVTATRLIERNLVIPDGDSLRTVLGTPVVAGSGYGVTNTVFATGPLTVHLGPIVQYEGFDVKVNDLVVKAERPAVVVWDDCCLVEATIP